MRVLNRVAWQTLRQNRARTLVTIVGILLSVAMFSAVATCVSSLQGYFIDVCHASSGSWHGALYGASEQDREALAERNDLRSFTALSRIGYAAADSQNAYKPYLYLMGMDSETTSLLPIHLTDGRLPKTDRELLLPQHLATNGGVSHQIGDALTLTPGTRQDETGEKLDQFNPYTEGEQLIPGNTTKTYTVVGFYERPSFENYSAPGYTALTWGAGSEQGLDLYIQMKNPGAINTLLDAYPLAQSRNRDLLEAYGYSSNRTFQRILYNTAGLLIAIIVLGSVALIYNAFSISMSERMQLFGILKSVGATRRQLRNAVLFEALLLSLAGVPAGLLAGIAGIGITLHFTGGLFAALNLTNYNVPLRLHLRLPLLAIAALLSLFTVILSAWLPARRASRWTPMEAIRRTDAFRIPPRRLRVGRWIGKIFGFEATLAAKNFKRSRRRYRVTVLSLFLSVVLFISASSFCAYFTRAARELVDYTDYALTFSLWEENGAPDGLLADLQDCSAVEDASYTIRAGYDLSLTIQEDLLSDQGRTYRKEDGTVYAMPFYLNDHQFFDWVRELGLDPADYADPENPVAVACDLVHYYVSHTEKYVSYRLLSAPSGSFTYSIAPLSALNGYTYTGTYYTDEGMEIYTYENEGGDRKEYRADDPVFTKTGAYRGTADRTPLGAADSHAFVLVYPAAAYPAVTGDQPTSYTFYIQSENPAEAEKQVSALLRKHGLPSDSLYSTAADQMAARALVMIVNIFAYGFIILISLIALANVFNTISTNIALRRREFAMLRSVGLTERGFQRMMRYECLLYGAKGLLWGLPAAFLVTLQIWRSFRQGWTTGFYLPWYSVGIAVGSVFLVVFATALYATRRLQKENSIDVLKNENL